MYALNERITRRVVLSPLSKDEVESYINHRLAVAGADSTIAFQPDAVKLIADLSRGLPRRVNLLCDRVLQEGRIDGAMSISANLVKRAARALAGAPPAAETISESAVPETVEDTSWLDGFRSRATRLAVAAGLGVVLVGGAGYAMYANAVMESDPGVPDLPVAKPLPIGEVAPTVKLPTDAELLAYFEPLRMNGG